MGEGEVRAVVYGNELAPVTSFLGFLRAPLMDVADALASWRRRLYGSVQTRRLDGGLRANAGALEPLTLAVSPRELLVATAEPGWTAVFDCGANGPDPQPVLSVLSERMGVEGIKLCSVPARSNSAASGALGARQLQTYAAREADTPLERWVSVIQDGRRWQFDQMGPVRDFEDVEAYSRRRVTDRFTDAMLIDYAAALGLRPFDPEVDFFPGPCVLIESPTVPVGPERMFTLAQARERLGITDR